MHCYVQRPVPLSEIERGLGIVFYIRFSDSDFFESSSDNWNNYRAHKF